MGKDSFDGCYQRCLGSEAHGAPLNSLVAAARRSVLLGLLFSLCVGCSGESGPFGDPTDPAHRGGELTKPKRGDRPTDRNDDDAGEIPEFDEETEKSSSPPSYRTSPAVHQYSGSILALGDPWQNSTSAASAATAHCGDGTRSPASIDEECDSGPLASAACSASCRVRDFLAAGSSSAAGLRREFGGSVHPISGHPLAPGGISSAAVTWQEAAPSPRVMLQLLDRHGNRLGTNEALVDGRFGGDSSAGLIQLDEGNLPVSFASPVVAPVYPRPPAPGATIDPRVARYVVAWNELGGQGSDLGIAFRKVTVDATGAAPVLTLDAIQHPSAGAVWGQQDPDLITLGGGRVILAWTDMRNPATAPDVRFRAFSHELTDIGEFPLAATSAVEGGIGLATVPGDGGAFFYAYREARPDGGETIVVGRRAGTDLESTLTVRVPAPIVSGKVQGPGPEGARPSVVGLDTDRALVVFPIGTDPNGTGVFQTFRLWGAVVDVTTNQVRGSGAIEPLVPPYASDPTVSLTRPLLVEAGNDGIFLTWQSAGLLGDAAAEELWLKKIHWSPTAAGMGLTLTHSELPLPRSSAQRAGDQRSPGLAVVGYPGGGRALAMAWEDGGLTFGPDAARPDIAVQIAPLPIDRLSETEKDCSASAPCAIGEGPCDSNSECSSGLCKAGRGPHRGYAPSIAVCELESCTNGVQDGTETGVDCGGPCGKCFTCPAATPYSGTAHYCSAVCPCPTLKGDCDGDSDCASGLVCAPDAGPQVNLYSFTDICLPPECTNGILDNSESRTDCGGPNCAPCQVGSPTYCSTALKCGPGEGHCDDSGECSSGTCVTDQGPFYGFAQGISVCVPSICANTSARGKPGDTEFCTDTCACADGIGICSSHTECLGHSSGLTKCTAGRGVNYGYPNEAKVCVPTHCFDGIANADESQVDCGGSCGDFCPRCGTVASLRHFETVTDWSRPSYASGGSAPALSASTDATNGTYSLKSTGSAYEELWSRDFTVDELDVTGSKIYLDVKHLALTPPASNTWIGSIELRVLFGDGSSHTLLPTHDFLQAASATWTTLEADVGPRLRNALRKRSAKFKLELRLNRTEATETFIDNLRFGGDTQPIIECYDGSAGSVVGPAAVSVAGSTDSIANLLSFESGSYWTGEPTAAVITDSDQTFGTNSLSVTQTSGSIVKFTSTQFASSALAAAFPVGLTQDLRLDVKTPPLAVANEMLDGALRLVLSCPSANLFWSDSVRFSSLPENQWTRARFTFPRALKTNLNTTGIDCALRLESELSGHAPGSTALFDHLRFESETPCISYTVSNSAPFLTNMPVTPDGSAKRPYPICTKEQLTTVRNSTSLRDSHLALMQDIDLTGWSGMISAHNSSLRGTFDGQGFTIRNHTHLHTHAYLGLFGWIEGDATVDGVLDGMIWNLRLENSRIQGAYALGALAGRAVQARIHNVTVMNPEITGTADTLGGLVGWSTNDTRIVDCSALGVQVKGATTYVGGLVGTITGIVRNCRSEGSVSAKNGIVGGLAGWTSGEVSDSSSSVTVLAGTHVAGGLIGTAASGKVTDSTATGAVTGYGAIGGLIGRASEVQIIGCAASGPVSGTTYKTDWGAGGLVGQAGTNIVIARSSATGPVNSPNGQAIGGLVGLLNPGSGTASITDSYATGNVSSYYGAGGLVGHLVKANVARAYSTGTVRFVSTRYVSGGLVGSRSGTITFSAALTRTASNPSLHVVGGAASIPGTYRFASSLFESSTAFEELGWDFQNVWIMGPSGPELR